MKILTLTTLYPNEAAPHHGVFVENRLRAFAAAAGAEIRVVAPVPWFPVAADWAGRYAAFARAPAHETRGGFEVAHPRYAIPPKIGMTYAAHALERCFARAARDMLRAGFDFDLIDAHYLYPDGVAAARLARRLGKPVVLTARGTDVNLIPKHRRQRAMILNAVRSADAVVCVAAALRKELIRIGAPAEKLHVLRNGVDLGMFKPLDREAMRRSLGLSGDVILSVGHLIERKGHHLVIEALDDIPEATLLIVGAGEMRAELEALALRRGVSGRVRFMGSVAHERLAEIYGAADVLALASSREGWPNVLLEAMACGTPVAATPVWGSVEVIRSPAAGALAAERSAPAMAAAIKAVLADRPARSDTRAYAERFSWDETSRGLQTLFEDIVAADRSRRGTKVFSIVARTPAPRMIVTVDTEEAFDWSRFSNVTYSVCPPADIDRFQQLARSHGAKPLYFMTHPLLEDAAVARYFRERHAAGEADLGLHLHQWATPPRDGFRGEFYSFQCNLPAAAYRAKLINLADTFAAAFGFRARAHRAGRFGIALASYAALAEVGIDMDFSPSPCFDFSRSGGPDFSRMSNSPFGVAPPQAKDVTVIPVSGGLCVRGTSIFLPRSQRNPGFAAAHAQPIRMLTAPTRITCEGTDLKDVMAVTRRLLADRAAPLTFSLHSTTMTPGGNPYAQTPGDVTRALEFCDAYFRSFTRDLGGEFIALDPLAGLLAPRAD